MPSLDHEAIVDLFRGHPRLVAEVMRAAFDLRLPEGPGQTIESTLSQVTPTAYLADLVVAFGDKRVIVEVQLSKKSQKRRSWLTYVATLEAREKCQAYLLVVTDSQSVEKWAAEPILFGNPGSVFHPLVLGPTSFPRIVDMEMARKHPDLTVLSALIRAGDRAAGLDLEALAAAWVGADALDDERSIRYADMVMDAAGPVARQILEVLMSTSHGYEFKSEFARKYVEKGRITTTAAAIIKVLTHRELPLSDAERTAIQSCIDLATLEHWHDQAFVVGSVEELLRTKPSAP